ncbi:hypothetical protein P886_3193 [Alteromonadaceae bacterium 2753L.S.0a.02]|nr:hypothetical protein P886_3193 [Alteromonadaceae bacterium 2753L.S.0a.02]
MSPKHNIYTLLEQKVSNSQAVIERFQIGLTWSSCRVRENGESNIGFAMSPNEKTRLLTWPGTVAGQKVVDMVRHFSSWNSFDVTLALAACNAVINVPNNELMVKAHPIDAGSAPNICVFSYFRSKLVGKKVVIIGRYPHLDSVLEGLDYVVLERVPEQGDLPDTAAETVIPEADWVFITSTSIINKTFSRLVELSANAVTVLMGPTTPWLNELADWGVDFVAGTTLTNADSAEQIAMEGGGTRLFEGGVSYKVANISSARLSQLKQEIAHTVEMRTALKNEMDDWYKNGGKTRFPNYQKLEQIDTQLSALDTAYKRLWDATKV